MKWRERERERVSVCVFDYMTTFATNQIPNVEFFWGWGYRMAA